MNPNAQLWVDALRSGDWEQGAGFLHLGDQWCCLGVACELYHEQTGKGQWIDQPLCAAFSVGGETCESALPAVVMDWLGLRSPDGHCLADKPGYDSLALRNDEGVSFEEIAALIESAPKLLFRSPPKLFQVAPNAPRRKGPGPVPPSLPAGSGPASSPSSFGEQVFGTDTSTLVAAGTHHV